MSVLVDDWGMRYKYASAFLNNYKKSITKMVASGRKKSLDLRAANLGLEGTILALDFEDPNLVLVSQAYLAYMIDLRKGKLISTPTEKAIWAILVNRSDLLGEIDRPLAKYIDDQHGKQFPSLFDEVFCE